MPINDLYNSILDEFESKTLNINDVLFTKEIKDTKIDLIEYIRSNRIAVYQKMAEKNNDSIYGDNIKKTIIRFEELNKSLTLSLSTENKNKLKRG